MESQLTGLSASNPLAALAAYGLLRSVPGLRMRWTSDSPIVNLSEDDVNEAALDATQHAASVLPQEKIAPETWLADLDDAITRGDDRRAAVLQGWGCVHALRESVEWCRTPLAMITGRQTIAGNYAKAKPYLNSDRMAATLFRVWDYDDDFNHTNLDNTYVGHGKMDQRPTDRKRQHGMACAWVLAMLALPYYPCQLAGKSALPINWHVAADRRASHNWVTWTDWLDAETAGYLITSQLVTQDQLRDIHLIGVSRLYRAAYTLGNRAYRLSETELIA